MMRYVAVTVAVLAFAFGAASADPAGTNVVINELLANPPFYYDGAEYIELHNPTLLPIDIGGWVLTGTEYDQSCGGEDRWQFPGGTTILPGDYVIVAKDGGDGEDGFYDVFEFRADFEQWDTSASFDSDDPSTPDMILLDPDPATFYSDEIQLYGGSGYGVACGGGYASNTDVVYLYDGPTLAVLVDVVEYYDDYECGGDPCVGDDLDDESGFPSIPHVGNAIGRDQYGSDTDRNVDDFRHEIPTPGVRNSLNAPPWITTVRFSPIPPVHMGAVTVTARITDDHAITGASLHYNVDGGGWNSVAMTPVGEDYSADVPGQADDSQVEYYVTATDDSTYTIANPIEGADEPDAYSVGMTSILEVQFVPGRQDESQLEGKAVNIEGIVTGGSDDFEGFFFVHDDAGPWHGVRVATYLDTDIVEGDDVTVSGTVRESRGQTTVYPHFDEGIVVNDEGQPNHGYTVVTSAQIDANSSTTEQYEGQLVSVSTTTNTSSADQYGQWYTSDDAGVSTVQVDDEAYYAYEAEVNDVVTTLRGVMAYDGSYDDEYELFPRGDEDIIGPPRITNVRYSPTPPVSGSNVTVSCTITASAALTSKTLYWKHNSSGTWNNIELVDQGGDLYEVDIGPFTTGDEIDYYVLVTDAATMDARRPSAGNYGFYVGTVSISDIQFVAAPGVDDASPLDGHAVNVEAYVVAESGVFGPYEFYIADAAGAWNGVAVYDGSGSLSFDRGDYITLSGTVEEYYGQTQIDLHFPETAYVIPPAARPDVIAPTDVLTGELHQSALLGEQYEGVYVRTLDCTVVDQNKGYGEWSASNTGAAIDDCRYDDSAEYAYEPANGAPVDVKGVVQYSFQNYKIQPRDDDDIDGPTGVPGGEVGRKLALAQNRPNPFNPKTAIAFNLPETAEVRLEIYDVAGRKVTTLVDKKLDAGPHGYQWDGRNQNGERVASGVYFYRLSTADRDLSKKMVLLK